MEHGKGNYEIIKMPEEGAPVYFKITANEKEYLGSVMHYHEEVEIIKIIEGEMRYEIEGCSVSVKKGQIIFINSSVPHASAVMKEDTAFMLMQFSPKNFFSGSISYEYKYLSAFLNSTNIKYCVFGNEWSREFEKHFDVIEYELSNKENGFDLYLKGNMYMVIAFLFRKNILKTSFPKEREELLGKLSGAILYMERYFMNNISLDDICRQCGFTPSYFCRIFKKATGRTFVEYLNYVRIREAEKLLMSSDANITEIFTKTGFTSHSYFNRVFYKYKNCNPSQYRKIKYISKEKEADSTKHITK